MEEFDALCKVFDALLGPNGCPWDKKQTVQSLRSNLLGEVHELLEAICLDDNEHICEELGDVFCCMVLLSKVAQKEGRFSMADALTGIKEKLIRRHPHVFGDSKMKTDEELKKQWEQIKRQEKGDKEKRTSVLDGIPPTLPTLARSQQVSSALSNHRLEAEIGVPETFELELGERLWNLVEEAGVRGLNAEEALRKVLVRKEQAARAAEGEQLAG